MAAAEQLALGVLVGRVVVSMDAFKDVDLREVRRRLPDDPVDWQQRVYEAVYPPVCLHCQAARRSSHIGADLRTHREGEAKEWKCPHWKCRTCGRDLGPIPSQPVKDRTYYERNLKHLLRKDQQGESND